MKLNRRSFMAMLGMAPAARKIQATAQWPRMAIDVGFGASSTAYFVTSVNSSYRFYSSMPILPPGITYGPITLASGQMLQGSGPGTILRMAP